VPQSMAYAQLAGLPPYYGLYAGFLPVMVAALWGSSNQLGTGPVAVVSLLTASTLAPFAAVGSEQFVALAILLALMVGVFQFGLGVFKLGAVVNFLSHPVIVGFTNAAALIIGLSQVNKLIGVPMGRSEHFVQDIWGVAGQVGDTHLPTLAMGVVAIAIIWAARKFTPRVPGVLVAVALTTVVSWQTGFEQTVTVPIEALADPEARRLMTEFGTAQARIAELGQQQVRDHAALKQAVAAHGEMSHAAVALEQDLRLLRLQIYNRERENDARSRTIRGYAFERVTDAGSPRFVAAGERPEGTVGDGRRWVIKGIAGEQVRLSGGGDVIGKIPGGLPSMAVPAVSIERLLGLLPAAIVISLVGFMEAISIAKAMAAKTRDRIDPNQELIGQGLANMVGAFTQSFPVSGSFSRSAVNLNAGARTGMSSVFAGLIVLVALLVLTPLLYHLPQAVLAAIIIMAVAGLINIAGMRDAWLVHRHDGIAAVVTFVATLAFAPHLDRGILVGGALAIVLYLLRTMTPRVAILGRHPDGTLRDVKVHSLPTSDRVTAVRFDGRLYFANVAYFEDAILQAAASNPRARYLLVVGNGINELDASGEEVMHHLVERLRDNGVTVLFSGLKKQVVDVMRATGLIDLVGERSLFATDDLALASIYGNAENAGDDPLRPR